MIHTFDAVYQWLVDESQPDSGPNDDQDFDQWIGEDFTAEQLKSLILVEDTVGTRVEMIAHAICNRIEMIEDPYEDPEDPFHAYTDQEREAELGNLLKRAMADIRENHRRSLGK